MLRASALRSWSGKTLTVHPSPQGSHERSVDHVGREAILQAIPEPAGHTQDAQVCSAPGSAVGEGLRKPGEPGLASAWVDSSGAHSGPCTSSQSLHLWAPAKADIWAPKAGSLLGSQG